MRAKVCGGVLVLGLVVCAGGPVVSAGKPVAKTTAPLVIGSWARADGVAIQVSAFEVADRCFGNGGGPATGAKLVYVWLAARNGTEKPIDAPSLIVQMSGVERDASWFGGTVCRYDARAYGNACWKNGGRLYPDVQCEGWQLFEVPERFEVSKAFVRIGIHKPGKLVPVGEWRLGGTE